MDQSIYCRLIFLEHFAKTHTSHLHTYCFQLTWCKMIQTQAKSKGVKSYVDINKLIRFLKKRILQIWKIKPHSWPLAFLMISLLFNKWYMILLEHKHKKKTGETNLLFYPFLYSTVFKWPFIVKERI